MWLNKDCRTPNHKHVLNITNFQTLCRILFSHILVLRANFCVLRALASQIRFCLVSWCLPVLLINQLLYHIHNVMYKNITHLFVFPFTEQSYRHNSVVTKVIALVHFFLWSWKWLPLWSDLLSDWLGEWSGLIDVTVIIGVSGLVFDSLWSVPLSCNQGLLDHIHSHIVKRSPLKLG